MDLFGRKEVEVEIRAVTRREREDGRCAKCSRPLVDGWDDLVLIVTGQAFCSFSCLPGYVKGR
jgi:hypothetical protein